MLPAHERAPLLHRSQIKELHRVHLDSSQAKPDLWQVRRDGFCDHLVRLDHTRILLRWHRRVCRSIHLPHTAIDATSAETWHVFGKVGTLSILLLDLCTNQLLPRVLSRQERTGLIKEKVWVWSNHDEWTQTSQHWQKTQSWSWPTYGTTPVQNTTWELLHAGIRAIDRGDQSVQNEKVLSKPGIKLHESQDGLVHI